MDKCQKIVHPLAKGAVDYPCRRPHYADGWCKQHHPEIVAAKEADDDLMRREWDAERKAKLEKAEGAALTIENAIVLLVKNGYRVELATPKAALTGAEGVQVKADEIDRLRQVARNVYEVWAGSEGIPMPETAAEAYLLQLVEQMRDEAKGGF